MKPIKAHLRNKSLNTNVRIFHKSLNRLHTTRLGVERIKRNLSLDTYDVIDWCKINSANTVITRNGKNWYANVDGCIITVNAHSYTTITAHKEKK